MLNFGFDLTDLDFSPITIDLETNAALMSVLADAQFIDPNARVAVLALTRIRMPVCIYAILRENGRVPSHTIIDAPLPNLAF
jgi:hypothetical protein